MTTLRMVILTSFFKSAVSLQQSRLRPLCPAIFSGSLRSLGVRSAQPRVLLGADGFGEDLKNHVKAHLVSKGVEVEDFGTEKYYEAAAKVAKEVRSDREAKGMLFCGTGMGVGIIANKFSGVFAATCENEAAARCSRAVNNANVLALGGKVTSPADATAIADAFLEQEFIEAPLIDGASPEWWSEEVEAFLSGSMEEIEEIEKASREA